MDAPIFVEDHVIDQSKQVDLQAEPEDKTEQGKKWQAIRNCDKALTLARKSKSANTLAQTHYKFALTLFKQGKWSKVFPHAEKAEQLFVQLKNKEMIGRSQTLYAEAEEEKRKKRASGFF